MIKKEYRSVFAEIGMTDKEINEKIQAAVQEFFYSENRLYHETADDMAYIEDTGNKDIRTEGMSYGMMLCVQLDMRPQFDRLWKWAKKYMYMTGGENEGYFAWSCRTNGEKNAHGPAPDGEEFFAMALLFASHRWGDGDGIYDYSHEARELLHACIHKGENGRPGAPMWNRENKLILFGPGCDFTDASYHLPHFYTLFAEWAYEEDKAFYAAAAEASRRYLAAACHPVSGMSPEHAFRQKSKRLNTEHSAAFLSVICYFLSVTRRSCRSRLRLRLCSRAGCQRLCISTGEHLRCRLSICRKRQEPCRSCG